MSFNSDTAKTSNAWPEKRKMKAPDSLPTRKNVTKRFFGSALVIGVILAHQSAAAALVDLGTAESFSVLAGSTVTNTGPSVISRDVGASPGSAITGFPPGIVLGTIHAADAVALQAQSNLTIAYNAAAGLAPTQSLTGQDLGGLTLVAGAYNFSSSAFLTGTLTLDAQGDPNAEFVFQIGSTLVSASGSVVSLINGAEPCDVFFQVGSSATLGTDAEFAGNILALTSITLNTGATLDGRALARNGAVTLDSNVITTLDCETVPVPRSVPETDGTFTLLAASVLPSFWVGGLPCRAAWQV